MMASYTNRMHRMQRNGTCCIAELKVSNQLKHQYIMVKQFSTKHYAHNSVPENGTRRNGYAL